MGRIVDLPAAQRIRSEAREQGQKVVFTNGCFDILHRGHIDYLNEARGLGDLLIVGLNSDRSVRELKGEGRPLQRVEDRAVILSNLCCVDYVVIFDEVTPQRLIDALVPDVLVKGGDYDVKEIVGRETVWNAKGKVVVVKEREGYSTSSLIARIKAGTCGS